VHFVVVDLDQKPSPLHRGLMEKYFRGYIPHIVVLDKSGKPLYNQSGEVDEPIISGILDRALQ
jgi:hypothetical protein